MDEQQAATLDCWAIVEMFGHQRIAGRVRAESFGAACLIRVDVPEIERRAAQRWDVKKKMYAPGPMQRIAAFTKFIGVSSIYALTPVTEELAREAARECAAEPVNAFGLESVRNLNRALPAGEEEDQDD